MLKPELSILCVDDDEDDYIIIKDLLKEIPENPYTLEWISSYDSAIKAIQNKQYHLYLVDYRLGINTGLDLLKEAIALGCQEPIIILTGQGDQKIDLEAMKLGAADYLVKNKIDYFILERAIRYALEHYQVFQAIKESELKYRNIFEKSRDVIYITDTEGRILDMNPSATRLFGYSREELLKLNTRQLYADEKDRNIFEELITKKGEVTEFEVALKNKQGEKIYCLLTTSLQLDKNGESKTYQGIIHDITRRKKLEQEQRRSEKHEVTERIAHTIAHEVRNPLTNVKLAIEQLKHEINGTNESTEIYFDIINRNTERINQLITELLNSAKPTQLKISKCSINELLDQSLNLAKDRILLKEIKIVKEYAAPNAAYLLLDSEKVKLAFLNIIINAIEAMKPKQGILNLKTNIKNNKCIVLITDNGSGIPSEHLGKLFEPFFSGKPKGVGLGLTTTQNIILNHKGFIDVESEPNKGTTFTIGFDI